MILSEKSATFRDHALAIDIYAVWRASLMLAPAVRARVNAYAYCRRAAMALSIVARRSFSRSPTLDENRLRIELERDEVRRPASAK